ncbi:MAG: methyltransferase domain-containing protein [Candidatus Atribacteria bacterium]
MTDWEEVYKLLRESKEWEELKEYLRNFDKYNSPKVEDIWCIMNQVWDDMGLDNKDYNPDQLSKYYSHPVWLLNGLFIETDRESMRHRKSIAEYFKDKKKLKILDYGGGFGTLAKEIVKQSPSSHVDIFEPHASEYGYKNIKDFKNIRIVDYLREKYYDVLVNTDVLEHIEDPIEIISIYNKCLKKGGILISHWNFTPCIKCHLPKHFHFRYTFDKIIPLLGFSKEMKNVRHGHFFEKLKNITKQDLNNAYRKGKISKLFYPLNKITENIKKIIRIVLKRLGIYDLVERAIKR